LTKTDNLKQKKLKIDLRSASIQACRAGRPWLC